VEVIAEAVGVAEAMGGNGGSSRGGPATKKQQNSQNTPNGHLKENFWQENKLFESILKATKQKIKH